MKKLILSLSLLGIIPAQAVQNDTPVKSVLNHSITKKTAYVLPFLWYFLIWKSRKAIEVEGDWELKNLITKLGTEGYFDTEWLGNSESKKEIEQYIYDENDRITEIIKDKKTMRKAYGLFGTFEAKVLNKLKDFSEFIKSFKDTVGFLQDPCSIIVVSEKTR